MGSCSPPDPSLEHLLGRLAVVRGRAAAAVRRRRQRGSDVDDALRGLVVSVGDAERILETPALTAAEESSDVAELVARAEAVADRAALRGMVVRLRAAVRHFGLSELDTELLLVAMAPDVDPRLEPVYGFLNDDVSRRRATLSLALELCGIDVADPGARGRVRAGAPLIAGGLLEVEDEHRPLPTCALRVPDRVVASLLGDPRPELDVEALLVTVVDLELDPFHLLSPSFIADTGVAYLQERPGAAPRALAARCFAGEGLGTLALDLSRLDGATGVVDVLRRAVREARLEGSGVVAGPIEAADDSAGSIVRALTATGWPVVLHGRGRWNPAWLPSPVVVAAAPPLPPAVRATLWNQTVGTPGAAVDLLTAHLRLGPEEIARAGSIAIIQARADRRSVDAYHVRHGARSQNGSRLDQLSRRIEPAIGWDDLVLPAAAIDQIVDVARRVRHRDIVIDEWAMRPGGNRGRGVTALFAGESGTGKTMAAEVLSADLGLDLYAINLATVVDKYIGETEKNLERIFTEAEGVNGMLLFDEADALFGKRSEVRDARDRYANIEVAYLLQRMESFDGLAILATNLRANLDEAFTRRLDAIVDFPMPGVEHRRLLWERSLARVGYVPDLDLEFCARSFELSGGHIRSIALSAAFAVAAAGRPLDMPTLIEAVQREYRKLGRLCVEAEFGEWHVSSVAAEHSSPPPS